MAAPTLTIRTVAAATHVVGEAGKLAGDVALALHQPEAASSIWRSGALLHLRLIREALDEIEADLLIGETREAA